MDTSYRKWKSITDKMYAGEITEERATGQLIDLLISNRINIRGDDHVLLAKSYWVYDKEDWLIEEEKPLGLGLVYRKPNGTKTQDIFIANPGGQIEKYYSDYRMMKKYPSMEGVHKNNLPNLNSL